MFKAAAKGGAEAAAKGAAEAAAKAAAKSAAEAAAKAAAKSAAEAGAKAAAKSASEAAAKAAAKGASEAGAKAAAKGASEAAAKSSSKLVKAGKYAAGAAVVVGGVYYAADPILEARKKNGAKLTITSITQGSLPDRAIVTYTEPIDICKDDKVTISGSDSETRVDGDFLLDKIISPTKLTIQLKDGQFISKDGTRGLMVLHTSVENQRSLLNSEIKAGAGNLLGKATDFISNLPGFKYVKYFFIFIACMIAFRIYSTVRGVFGFGKKSNGLGKKFRFNGFGKKIRFNGFGSFFKKRR